MPSSNISTSRLGTCGSCQDCPCHQRESVNPHYAPHRNPDLIRNRRPRRYPGPRPLDDRYQSAEDNYPRADYSTSVHRGSGNFSRALREDCHPEAPDVYAEPKSPSPIGYTFYSEDSDLEGSLDEAPLDYSEPSTIHSNISSPSILTPDYSSEILDAEDLPLDIIHDGHLELADNTPRCLGRNHDPDDADLHQTFDFVKSQFPALFAAFLTPHSHGYLDQLMYLRANIRTLDPPTRRFPKPFARFSPAPEDDPFYYLSARSCRHGLETETGEGYMNSARLARMNEYDGTTPWSMHSVYKAAHEDESEGEIFTMGGVPSNGFEDVREEGYEADAEEEVIAYEYPTSGARGDPLGYYPPSGRVPRYY